jgi:hypothetical protein
MFSKNRSFLLVTIVIVATLSVVSVVYAAYVTINTNNGAVDDWSSVPVLVSDGVDVSNSNYDINNAWMGNDAATPSEVYFRVDLVGGPLPSLGDSLEARLDCSTPADGDFQDPEDMVVYYYLGIPEDIAECQGNLYATGCPFASIEQNGATFGEEIGTSGSPYTYEWKADISGSANWSACLGDVNVQFASFNGISEVDSTAWGQGGYSIPTSVMLADIAAQGQVMPAIAIVLSTVAVGSLIVIRRKNKGE